ncbi:MAG: RagB/SusD family nutrient uptake outer membrane protein [Bacteroidia bacterium]|nr:RagB/SusD family nutrient uptake outer membrane protein [Bacteroidales bacterium]MDY0285914.1 RagB/SusD family nutrient uptake outer membrane protein [Bacteroidales bacterium]NCD42068.1 RagB/SusD family nutrient uptake outer membrane protein [Bacteroidia bacterium]HPE57647.1 RagB/SusD family nutrient uptake outer membrane protein [Bacteroidales bacterium]
MKKMIYSIAVIFLLIASGCEKFLDEQPQGQYSTADFFQTADHALLAINAAYVPLSFANSDNRLWVFAEVASDDAVKGGFPGDQADIGLIDNFLIYSDNGNIETTWGIYYEGISRCNAILDNVPDIAMEQALKDRILGEAYFLRGLYYFQLCNIFGNVPLILRVLNPDEMQVPNTTREEVLLQIKKDFSAAVEKLGKALNASPGIYPSGEFGRATPGAALAFLAKTYLLMENWEAAYTTAREVKNYGYALMEVYNHNFQVAYENNMESIFEIQHISGFSPVTGSRLNQWLAPRARNGYGFDEPTQDFVNAFEITATGVADPRLDYTIGRKGGLWINGEPYDTTWSSTGFSQKKYLQPETEIPLSTRGDADLNFTLMRYAEVLLIEAEALCEAGMTSEALAPLNEVRRRAREAYLYDETLPGYGTIPEGLLPEITTTDPVQLRAAIRHERRVELGFECQRYFDIMRYGQEYANAALGDRENFNYMIHKVFPIPQSELETNGNITQNYGYNQ